MSDWSDLLNNSHVWTWSIDQNIVSRIVTLTSISGSIRIPSSLTSSTHNIHVTTGGVVIPFGAPEDIEEIGVDGTTISDKKYSWKRGSGVSSGWKVVRRRCPCRNATTLRGSLSSSCEVAGS